MTPHTAHSRQTRTQEEPMDTLLDKATDLGLSACADCGQPVRLVHRFPDGLEPAGYRSHQASVARSDDPLVEALRHIKRHAGLAYEKSQYGDYIESDILEVIHATEDALATIQDAAETPEQGR